MDLKPQVLKSAAGYYIGTQDEEGPVSRLSQEYWPTVELAETALESNCYTPRNWV